MSKTFAALALVADKIGADFPDRCAHETIPVLAEKLGDMKVQLLNAPARNCSSAITPS